MWDQILTGLEENKCAVTLMSVDFSKAFNRMQHQACLNSLARRGASNQSIRMVYSFLKGRTMLVKNGFKYSEERKVTGGSPQGTKLGNLLFCLTVEGIHEQWNINQEIERPMSPVQNVNAELRLPSCSSPNPSSKD